MYDSGRELGRRNYRPPDGCGDLAVPVVQTSPVGGRDRCRGAVRVCRGGDFQPNSRPSAVAAPRSWKRFGRRPGTARHPFCIGCGRDHAGRRAQHSAGSAVARRPARRASGGRRRGPVPVGASDQRQRAQPVAAAGRQLQHPNGRWPSSGAGRGHRPGRAVARLRRRLLQGTRAGSGRRPSQFLGRYGRVGRTHRLVRVHRIRYGTAIRSWYAQREGVCRC